MLGKQQIALLGLLFVGFLGQPILLAADLDMRDRIVETISKSAGVSPLANDVFGDQIDLKNGSVTFSYADIDIPGNDALPVRLGRRLTVEDKSHQGGFLGGFGPWGGDVDIPYAMGTFATATGWQLAGASPNARCSTFGKPPIQGSFDPDKYWNGYWINIPGEGKRALLANPDPAIPLLPGSAPWITKGFARVTCVPAKNGYPGEGFVIHRTDGTKYFLDWAISKSTVALSNYAGHGINGTIFYDRLERSNVYLLASRIEDRFGNWVNYAYVGDKLSSITSSDGRFINVLTTTADGQIATVSSSVGNWTYSYSPNSFTVTRPDTSKWTYVATGQLKTNPALYTPNGYTTTCPAGEVSDGQFAIAITSPSGAQGAFTFGVHRHFRHNIPKLCNYSPPITPTSNYYYLTLPNYSDTLTLQSKTISGPGLTSLVWTYTYGIGGSPVAFTSNCGPNGGPLCRKTIATEVVGPDRFERHTFGAWYGVNEGQLVKVEVGSDASNIVETNTFTYMDEATAIAQPFPESVGSDLVVHSDGLANEYLRPLIAQTISRDGATFNASFSNFDVFARSSTATRWSEQTTPGVVTNTKTDTTEFYDDSSLWVLGQALRETTAGIETSRIEYGWKSLPWKVYTFGKLQQTFTYDSTSTIASGQLGTVNSVADGNNNLTVATAWKRGIPQTIQYPATPEAPSGATQTAMVNDNGWITAVTDENGFSTGYGYDAMGRLASIVYPTGDSTVWNTTTQSFVQINFDEHGLAPGHWRSSRATGNGYLNIYYDAMWRPVLEEKLDLGNINGTVSQVVKRYDVRGRLAFQSYPVNNVSDFQAVTQGARTFYDPLDRVTRVEHDSELGILASTTVYQTGFQTLSTNPRGLQVTTEYQAYDQPTTDFPTGVTTSADTATEIHRDVFHKPTLLVRRNHANTQRIERRYVYQADQQLCKTIEPEVGATVYGYDWVGNLTKSASGLQGYGDLNDCNHPQAWASGRAVDRTYDARNRLNSLTFPDGKGNQAWTYTPDGQPASITTNNFSAGGSVVNSYAYNKRRMLVAESVSQPGWYTWNLGYGYDGNGSLATQTYPTSLVVSYAPNALGQATQAGSYANGVQYHPNGAIKQFTYGNGIVHTMVQNARQLPQRSTDSGGTLDLAYSFDANANVNHIWDYAQDSGNGFYGRWMTYDGLDRLTDAGSCSFGGDCWHRFTYDALDNLKSWKLPGIKDYAEYVYDAKNQLTNIKDSTGATVVGFGYDVQGNLSNKNGFLYQFDYGNRLRSNSLEQGFTYDGHGRRASVTRGSMNPRFRKFAYAANGQLLYEENTANNSLSEHIYLGGSLIATRSSISTIPNGQPTVTYAHTDALGSPVAKTNQAGVVQDRTSYEPYGTAINKPTYEGIGYTGHVQDGASGLTYMQQRYYDPAIGKMLSVDPVTAYSSGDFRHFNVYAYAYNNPYRFTDPDGRAGNETIDETMRAGLAGPPITRSPTDVDIFEGVARAIFSLLLCGGCDMGYVAPAGSGRVDPVSYPGEVLFGGKVGSGRLGSSASGLGDLSRREVAQIQNVVDEAGRPLSIVGSAAKGARRNPGSDLPMGKGPGKRSDIDYVAPGTSHPNFNGLEGRLPSLDPGHGIIRGVPDPADGRSIRFEPYMPPKVVE